jgi:uncharacterized protein YkwD
MAVIHHKFRYAYFLLIILPLVGCHSEDSLSQEDVRAQLLQQINDLRQNGCQCGDEMIPPVKTLEWNSALEDAAANHASDMFTNDYFSHLSLDGSSHITRAQRAGYTGDYVGEVIARKYYRTKDVIDGWKKSESHCRALMDSLYNEMGGASKGDYWVVDLGRSK